MANAQPGGDVSQRGPAEYLDPLAPLASQFQQVTSMMELVFDDYEAFMLDLTEAILALPPDERFTRSHEILRDHVEDQFGSTDAFASILPESDPAKLPAFLEQVFDTILTDVLEGVFFQREPAEHLAVAALFQTLDYSVQRLRAAEAPATRNRLASILLALVSRLQQTLADSPESLPDDVIWDTALGLHHLTSDDAAPAFPHPEELSDDAVRQAVIEFGAVVAYARLNISLSRGAELAGVAPDAFQASLERYAIEPRFGPNSIAELSEDRMDG